MGIYKLAGLSDWLDFTFVSFSFLLALVFFFLLVSLSSGDICKAEEFPAKEFTIAPVCTPFSGCGSQRLDPDQQQQLLRQLRTVKNADCLAHPRVLNQELDQSSVFCVLTSSPGDS